jgi:chemotaxis protein histidine kinase CheA
MIDLDDELAEEYLAECREHLAAMETDLLAIEKGGPAIDEELVNRVFGPCIRSKEERVFRSGEDRDLAHQTEDVLVLIRSGRWLPRRTESAFCCVPPTGCTN